MEKGRGVFADLEEFVNAHRAWAALTGGADDPTADGYLLRITCSAGTTWSGRVSPAS